MVKCLKVIAKCSLNWAFSHGALYCCVRHSNIEFECEIFKTYHQYIAQKVMVKSRFRRRFHDCNFFEFEFLHIPWICYKFDGHITKKNRKHQFNVILLCFKQILDNYMFNISTCALLAPSSKICRLFLEFFCQHKLLALVDQCFFFQMFRIFPSQNANLVYSFESLSLNICR